MTLNVVVPVCVTVRRDSSSGCAGDMEVNDAAVLKTADLHLLKGTLSSFFYASKHNIQGLCLRQKNDT